MPLRTFVAVPVVDDAVLGRLAEATRALGARGVKWTAPHQLHFTLKFMGDLGEELVAPVKDALVRAAARHERFALKLEGLGSFPPRGPARVVWAGCADEREALEALAADVETELVAAGAPAEERPFRAHLTLGRVKDPRDGRGVVSALREAPRRDLGAVDVRELVLFQSVLGAGGPAHTPLARAPLAQVR